MTDRFYFSTNIERETQFLQVGRSVRFNRRRELRRSIDSAPRDH